jgi:hypothetical protein
MTNLFVAVKFVIDRATCLSTLSMMDVRIANVKIIEYFAS